MADNSKSFLKRLIRLTQPSNKRKTALQLESLDVLIDSIVRKNNLVVTSVQGQINQLDVVNFPSSTGAAKYRWERLIKDLNALSDRLQHLKQSLHKMQVRKALYMFTFDLWPLALKISCRHQIETGVQGDWIEDTSALYLLCEQYAEEVQKSGNVSKSDDSLTMRDRGENTMRVVDVNRPSDEDHIYDSNDGKRAS